MKRLRRNFIFFKNLFKVIKRIRYTGLLAILVKDVFLQKMFYMWSKISIFIFFLCAISVFGQMENFSIVEKRLVWEKSFQTQFNKNEIFRIFKNNDKLKNLEVGNNSISGIFQNLAAIYKDDSENIAPAFATENSVIYGNFEISNIENGGYRVKIWHIQLKPPVRAVDIKNQRLDVSNIEGYIFKLGTTSFRKSFINTDYKIYDFTFSHLFDLSRYKYSS